MANIVTEEDILFLLENDYHRTLNTLQTNNLDYSNYSDNFNEKIKEILIKNNYIPVLNDRLFSSCCGAYYAGVYNGSPLLTNVNFKLKNEEFAKDLLNIEAIKSLDYAGSLNKYFGVLSRREIQEILVKRNTEMESNMSFSFAQYIAFVDEEFAELINEHLKDKKIIINEDNQYLLQNPLIMMRALETDDPKKIFSILHKLSEAGLIRTGDSGAPLSDKQYRRLKKYLSQGEFYQNQENTCFEEFNIALISLSKGYISAKDFIERIKQQGIMRVHPLNIDRAKKVLMQTKLKFLDFKPISIPTNLIATGYLSNPRFYSAKKEYGRIKNAIKKYNLSPLLIPYYQLSGDIVDKLVKDEIITEHQKEVILFAQGVNNYSKEIEKVSLMMISPNYKDATVEEVLKLIKDKNKDQLTFEELNIIQVYGYKLLNEAGINDCKIDLFSYIDDMWVNGNYQEGMIKVIKLNNSANFTVSDMVKILHHEIHHAIQFKNVREVNVDEDEDVLDYSKDMILRSILDEGYYRRNYKVISYEFDANYKAEIQNSILFNYKEELFAKCVDDLKGMDEIILENTFREFIRDGKFLNELFIEQIQHLHMTKPLKYKKVVDEIKSSYPIIEYEFDLNKGEPKTLFRLVKEMYNADDEKTKAIYKNILKNRCSIARNGADVAMENKRRLENGILKLFYQSEKDSKSILANESKYEKYEKYFKEICENIELGARIPTPKKGKR